MELFVEMNWKYLVNAPSLGYIPCFDGSWVHLMLQPLGNMKEDHSPPSLVPTKWLSFSSLLETVRTYVIHLLGTYVTILCNWLILWQNALYLYLGRSKMCLMLQEISFQVQVLKPCKFVQDSSAESVVH